MNRKWWKESVVYQIYPRSFQDSNGDGIGDLQGIIQRLDYIKKLGANVIWLSPIYQSPNADNGYDISDYHNIMDEFGTMDDFDQLLAEVHKRDMKLVMDLVVNHTSDEHAWFVESRSSKDNPKRDWYIWRPGKDGREPNNWASFFSGSAWQYDETTDEYYLHLFAVKQPDLNWENPTVRQEIYKMMRWWLDKGVDGFRMDVINMISKTPGLPDMPVETNKQYIMAFPYFANGPRIHEFLTEMKREVLSKYDIMTVGETGAVTTKEAISYTHEHSGELNMVFHFEHMDVDKDKSGLPRKWRLTELKKILSRWQHDLHQGQAWNSLYFNNHDQPRSVSRFGDDGQYRVESAKMLATALFLQQGTPYIYQGEEIGMTNVAFPSIEDYRDIATLNRYQEAIEQGIDPALAMAVVYKYSRDNARTPVQWNAQKNAGFSEVKPWLAVNPNYTEINVEQALADPNSIFYYYQKLIKLRQEHLIFVYGDYQLLLADSEQIFAYTRSWQDQQVLVVANFTGEEVSCDLSDIKLSSATLVLSNYSVEPGDNPVAHKLKPYEARVYQLT